MPLGHVPHPGVVAEGPLVDAEEPNLARMPHGDHVDYLHDGHRHAAHEGHYDEHAPHESGAAPAGLAASGPRPAHAAAAGADGPSAAVVRGRGSGEEAQQ